MSTKALQARVDELEKLVAGLDHKFKHLEASAVRSAATLREKIENLETNSAQAIVALVDRIEKLEANSLEKIQEYLPINATLPTAATDCRRLRNLQYYHDD